MRRRKRLSTTEESRSQPEADLPKRNVIDPDILAAVSEGTYGASSKKVYSCGLTDRIEPRGAPFPFRDILSRDRITRDCPPGNSQDLSDDADIAFWRLKPFRAADVERQLVCLSRLRILDVLPDTFELVGGPTGDASQVQEVVAIPSCDMKVIGISKLFIVN